MFNIVNKRTNIYTDITVAPKTSKKAGFTAYEKTSISTGYDLRTNKSRQQKIKMREIKKNEKR